MKKVLSVLLALVMAMGLFAGCGQSKEEETTIRVGGLKGPTSIGMVKLLSDSKKGESESKIEFTMAGKADELTPKLIKGELDVLAVPANLGAILYNNPDADVQFAAINTLGVIYIGEKGGSTINSIADLQGKTIYASGKGQTPEYALSYLLSQHNLELGKDVKVEWKTEPTEVVAAIKTKDSAVVMLPQPFVTVASTQVPDLRIALSLTDEWDKLDNGSMFITAGLIVRTEFAKKYPQQLAKFLEEYEASTKWINENVEEGALLVEEYDIVKAAIAQKAIPMCNVTYIDGKEMKTAMDGYLKTLFDLNAKSIGGKMPGEDFYYNAK